MKTPGWKLGWVRIMSQTSLLLVLLENTNNFYSLLQNKTNKQQNEIKKQTSRPVSFFWKFFIIIIIHSMCFSCDKHRIWVFIPISSNNNRHLFSLNFNQINNSYFCFRFTLNSSVPALWIIVSYWKLKIT